MGWKVNADPPGPSSFAAATQFVTPAQVAAGLSCGPNVETHVQKIKTLLDAGFTGVALLQIGGDTQEEFTDWARAELLPALLPESDRS